MEPIAFISDIHGNIDALDAVFLDIDRQGIDSIYCLGDIVGYGASPAECVQRVRERCAVTVLGNHDELAVKGPERFVLSERVAAGIRHARKELSKNQLEWLRKLPLSFHKSQFTIVHASLDDPETYNYITDETYAKGHFRFQQTPLSFIGHTHVPCVFIETDKGIQYANTDIVYTHEKQCRYIFNVGSVGQPRDNNSQACYCTFDMDLGKVSVRRVPYDIAKAQSRIVEANLPIVNAERLSRGG